VGQDLCPVQAATGSRPDQETRFALLLVGADGAWKVLHASRCCARGSTARVSFTALSTEQVCALIPTFHSLYIGVDTALLLFINDHFAHGNLRGVYPHGHRPVPRPGPRPGR
jgi:hypothetical protein